MRKRDAEVVDAAVRVFHERGYADATVQDIADELGILKGSLYHYIDTKEDLLFRVLESVHEETDVLFEEVKAVEGLAPLDRLALYVRRQVLYNVENLPRITVYYHDMDQLGEERRSAVVERRRAADRFVTGLIREAQERRDVDASLDAKLLSNCVFATIVWTYRWYRPGRRASRETVADVCARFALAGVRGGSPPGGAPPG